MLRKTLNLGCGGRVYKEYPKGYRCINMDNRKELTDVDIVGDIKDLNIFKNESFNYILASDIIEHFTIKEIPSILLEWSRVLTKDGILEFRTPNLRWVLDHYSKNYDAKFVSYHIFGGQDYAGNFHKVIFDCDTLTSMCLNACLYSISCTTEGSNFILKVIKKE